MTYDADFIEELFYGDEKYKQVTDVEIVDQRRWHTHFTQVFQKLDDDTYWRASWSRGSTEQQDDGIEDFEFEQVRPVEKTVIVYERK